MHRHSDGRVCVCVCVCARAYVRACVRDVFAIFDDNIFPRLIMIKIIILYLIQIRHTDDFPSTGTRLVLVLQGGPIYGKIRFHRLFQSTYGQKK